jgi:hypothetical protein
MAFVQLCLGAQVHDSLQIQSPIPQTQGEWERLEEACQKIQFDYMRPELNYGEDFRLNCDLKLGVNWGDMFKVKTKIGQTNIEAIQIALDAALEKSSALPAGSEEAVEAELEREILDRQSSELTDPYLPAE